VTPDPLPRFHEFLGPVLEVLVTDSPRRARDIAREVADLLHISADQREATIASGQSRYDNRVNWAMSYLYQAATVTKPQRGVYAINDRGRQLLAERGRAVTLADLRKFPEYREFKARGGSRSSTASTVEDSAADGSSIDDTASPLEQAADAIARIDADVEAELLQRLHDREPEFLEKAVLKVLHAMGYGGTEDDVQHMGGPGDGGFDGVINQDALGIGRVYVQAKRYALDTSVGRPEVQGFLGALHAVGAAGGVFITTGRFSKGARDFAVSVTPRIVLVDGNRLARLMLTHGIGVQEAQVFRVVEVDEDFFE